MNDNEKTFEEVFMELPREELDRWMRILIRGQEIIQDRLDGIRPMKRANPHA